MSESHESFVESDVAGFTRERREPRPEDDYLLALTQNWLGELPKGARPIRLPAEFPRITNELARLWHESPALYDYFEEKEFSPRAGRRGFPPVIKEELLCLHVYAMRHRPMSKEQRPPQQASLLS